MIYSITNNNVITTVTNQIIKSNITNVIKATLHYPVISLLPSLPELSFSFLRHCHLASGTSVLLDFFFP